jgi:hypothetical protein
MSCNGGSNNTYDISDPVELLATFTLNSLGTGYDPEVVRVEIASPDYVIQSYVYGTDSELIRDSSGSYSLITFPTMPGRYHYRWEAEDSSSDAREGAQEASFLVRYSYIQAAESWSATGSTGGFDGGTP